LPARTFSPNLRDDDADDAVNRGVAMLLPIEGALASTERAQGIVEYMFPMPISDLTLSSYWSGARRFRQRRASILESAEVADVASVSSYRASSALEPLLPANINYAAHASAYGSNPPH
jgi:hypothetical protein